MLYAVDCIKLDQFKLKPQEKTPYLQNHGIINV
jgi:hypothetical protein